MRLAILLSLALGTGCVAASPQAAESPCTAAAEHVALCAGLDVPMPTECSAEDASEAEAVLGSTCEQLVAGGKADGFRCSWLGRKLHLCHAVAAADDVLASLGDGRAEALPASMRVLVWNVYKGERDEWDDAMQTLAGDADVALVQEFLLDDDSRRTYEAVDHLGWTFATSFFVGGEGGERTGVATGSRAAPVDVDYQHSEATEPLVGTPKSILFTRYAIEGRDEELLVVNAHAINFRWTGAFEDQIDAAAETMAEHEGPMILAGDFNTWWPERTDHLVATADVLGLKPVGYEGDDRSLVLDWVFVRGLDVDDSRLVDSEASDHRPIQLRLTAHAAAAR